MAAQPKGQSVFRCKCKYPAFPQIVLIIFAPLRQDPVPRQCQAGRAEDVLLHIGIPFRAITLGVIPIVSALKGAETCAAAWAAV